MGWHDSGNCHWCDWSVNDSNYDYYVRLASNTYSDSRCYPFNVRNSLPNVSQPDGSEEYCVINGSIGSATPYNSGVAGYNIGGQVTLNGYNAQQYNWGATPRDYNYLVMYTWGGANMSFTTANGMDAGSAYLSLGCPARDDGTGEGGCSATTSHAFIGSNGTTNYFGYSTGITGAATVSYMKSQYGGTCAILDGGGSTYCRYQGTTKKNTDGRFMYNALAVYRKVKSTPTVTYTISTSVTPSGGGSVSGGGTYNSGASCTLTASASSGYTFSKWSDGSTTNPRTFTVTSNASYTAVFESIGSLVDDRHLDKTGKSYVLIGGVLKKANPWYYLKTSSQLVGRPKNLYMVTSSGMLQALISKYNVVFQSNGGSSISNKDYYWGESIGSLPTPTHSNYDGRACTFKGWFKDNTFASQTTGIGSNASGDRTLYAKWEQSKTQYSGTYTYTEESTTTQGLTDGEHNRSVVLDQDTSSQWSYWSDSYGTYSSDVTITEIFANFDYCDRYWSESSYTKPTVYYGYWKSGSFTQVGTMDAGSTMTTSFNLPKGANVGFKCHKNDGVIRYYGYLYKGSYYKYKTTSTKTGTVGWTDYSGNIPDPPKGSWASGSPSTRTVTRYYNGSSWTSWS